LAHIPMVLDTRIRSTLNVGLGSGTTLQALAAYAELEVLDCVEINQAVVNAVEYFPESAVLEDPRVNLFVEDAVYYLLRPGRDYDLIVSDGKQDPFFSGNAPLLCREFYEYAFNRLTPDGLFVQWNPLSTLHEDMRIVLRSFCQVFPYAEVMCLPPDSVLLVGASKPIFKRPRMSGEQFSEQRCGEDLGIYLIDNPSSLLSCGTASKAQLTEVLGEGPVSTWDHLLLDFTAYKATHEKLSDANGENMSLFLEAERTPRAVGEDFELEQPAYADSGTLIRQAYGQVFIGNDGAAKALAEKAVRANPADRAARAVLRSIQRGARRHQNKP